VRAPWLAAIALTACGRIGFDGAADGDVRIGLRYAFDLDAIVGHTLAGENGIDAYAWNSANVVAVPGMRGNGMHFDGTTGQAYALWPVTGQSCAPPPAITGSLTVATWVQFDELGDWSNYSLSNIAVMHGTNGGTEGGWGLGATNGCGPSTAGFTLTAPAAINRFTRCGTTALVTGRWYFLTGVYDADAGTADVYVDGVRDSGAQPNGVAVPPMLQSPGGCLHLASGLNQMKILVGALDEVRIYDRALSSDEVGQLYRYAGG